MERALWLGRFVEPEPIRREAGLHLYTCLDAASAERRLVLLGAPATERVSAGAVLDGVAQAHAAIDHPLIPRLAERSHVGEIEFVALMTDAVIDLGQIREEFLLRGTPEFAFARSMAMYRLLLEALEVAHATTDPLRGGLLCVGHWSWANLLVSEQGRPWLIGVGRPRQAGPPWLVPVGTEHVAPEVQAGSAVTPSADLWALNQLFLSMMPMAVLPPVMARILAGQLDALDEATLRLVASFQTAATALLPSARHQSAREAQNQFAEVVAALAIEVPPDLFQSQMAPVLARMHSREQATAPSGGARPASTMPTSVAGRYRIERVLGEGGMGQVYLAWDRQLQQRVALKGSTLGENPEHAERFLREVRIARQVRHPHLIHGYDVVSEDGRMYAVIEYIEGERLDVHCALRPEPALAVARLAEVADALASLHGLGIVHRDVKPSNILVHATRGAVLLDYGIASELHSDLTRTGASMGTPRYMAPEQVTGGQAGPECDVYALGVVIQVLFERIGTQPPTWLRSLMERCLEAVPDRRPRMEDLARSLASGGNS